jgi:hypothetical protein
MKKVFGPKCFFGLPLILNTARVTTCGSIAIVLQSGCATSLVHWDAVQMRQHVIDYYNDEIMDNLIRAKNRLPFVHVDIVSLSANSNSKLAGTVNGGQTLNNTGTRQETNQTVITDANGTSTTAGTSMSHMVAGTMGVVATVAHMATRPFTFSVSPEHSDNLTVTSNPVVGSTGTKPLNGLYLGFVKLPDCNGNASIAKTDNPNSLTPDRDYVPGTMKKWGGHYYFVPFCFKERYFELCLNIFAQERPKPATLIQTAPILVQ